MESGAWAARGAAGFGPSRPGPVDVCADPSTGAGWLALAAAVVSPPRREVQSVAPCDCHDRRLGIHARRVGQYAGVVEIEVLDAEDATERIGCAALATLSDRAGRKRVHRDEPEPVLRQPFVQPARGLDLGAQDGQALDRWVDRLGASREEQGREAREPDAQVVEIHMR